MRHWRYGAIALSGWLLLGWGYACSAGTANPSTTADGGGGGAGGGGVAGSGPGGSGLAAGSGGMLFDASSDGSGQDACAATSAEANFIMRPVDIIIVVDNSGSMGTEISAIQSNVNGAFASQIESSGIDYRVILIGDYGAVSPDESICIEQPLSSMPPGGCSGVGGADPVGPPPNNPPQFYHYSQEVGSHDSLCLLLDRFDQPDEYGQPAANQGWGQWLRDDAFKMFVEVSDDGVDCTWGSYEFDDQDAVAAGEAVALDFDTALLERSPVHFGTESERNYRFYAIVGLGRKGGGGASPWEPYDPGEPVPLDGSDPSQCETAWGPGTGYQWLAKNTGALRFPVCEGLGYHTVFGEIAEGVIEGAAIDCEFEMPEAPPGEELDPDTLVVRYTPGDGGPPIEFGQVSSPDFCDEGLFYIENNIIKLCPETCALVEADIGAVIDILIGCGSIIR